MTQADLPPLTIPPGTAMQKVIPPPLVEPYLSGRRSVIAGYVHRARDCALRDPAEYYHALALGYEGSGFHPDMPVVVVMRWLALDVTTSMVLVPPRPGSPAPPVPEYYTLPVPIPVGAEMYRVSKVAAEAMARYDGQVWLRAVRGR